MTVLLVVLATVGGAVLLTPEPVAAHGPDANGCTGVPDTGYGFRFHNTCDRHDRCYGTKPYGDGFSGRRSCDRVFRDEMRDYCSRYSSMSAKGVSCRSVAAAYYVGVRLLGGPSWHRSEPPAIA